jgi:hypothetical protein
MKNRTLIGFALAMPLLFAGCYPNGPEYIEEYDLVLTNYAPEYDFYSRTTYSLPDSVVNITGDVVEGGSPDMMDPGYADPILSSIRENLNARGWHEVGEAEDPDVVLLPSVFTSTTVTYYYDWWYWGWYYPYYGYGWYYPGYYPTYVTSYTTGTLLIQMTDPNDIPPTENVPVVWTAAFNGLLEGSTRSLVQRVDEAIDQAFQQSDYLNH